VKITEEQYDEAYDEATIYFAESGHDREVSCLEQSYDEYFEEKFGIDWELIT
jgi:hypothetical protein